MARAPRLLAVIGLVIVLGLGLNTTLDTHAQGGGLEDGLISVWEMEETSGVRYDSYGPHDLTDNNTVRSGEGIDGNAAVFSAANHEYLSHPDTDTLSFDQEFTIITQIWMSATQTEYYESLVRKWDENVGDGEYFLLLENRKPALYARPNSVSNDVIAPITLTTETWHCIAAWMDSSNLYLQIDNGDVISEAHTGGSLTNTTCEFWINDYNLGLNGKIDTTQIWSRTLTPLERQTVCEDQFSPAGGETVSNTVFLPLVMHNWPPWDYPDDPDPEDPIIILGPPGEDNLWRQWVEIIDGIIDPVYERIQEVWAGIADLNDRGCGIEETYVAQNSLLMQSYSMLSAEGTMTAEGLILFDPDATFQETSENLGLALGEPIGLMRGFIKANIAPVSYIMLTLNFLVAAVGWIVFVEAFALSVWLIRSLIDIIYKAWMALPFT